MVAKQLVRTVLAALVGLAAMQGCALETTEEEGVVEQGLHDPPTNVIATATAPDRITVSWTLPATGTKSYVYQSVAGGPYALVGSVLFPGSSLPRAGLTAGTTYCYQVVTDGPEGASAPSAPPACATTPGGVVVPMPPTAVTATPTSSDRITVSWSAVAGASRYFVHQSVGSAGPYTLINTALAPTTSIPVANLMAGTNYCYRVQAVTNGGSSAMSTEACATTIGAGLEGFWKFNAGSGTAVEDASGWARHGSVTGNVTYTTDKAPMDGNRFALSFGGGTGDAVSIPDQSVFRLAGSFSVALWVKLDASPTGTLRLIGKRAAGCGVANWELAQDAANQLHLRGANVASFGQSLPVGIWTHVAVTHANGTARLYLDGLEVANAAFTIGTRNTAPLEIGNSGGCGSEPAWIDHVSVHTRALAAGEIAQIGTRPAAPTSLTATAVSARRIDLSWDPVPGAFKYFVYKGTTSGDQVLFASVLAPTVTLSDSLNQPGTQTSWIVRSVQNSLISDSSNEQLVSTLPPPAAPTSLVATAVSSTRINLTWDAVPGAVKYYIYQSVAGGPYAIKGSVLASSPTPTSFGAANLTANTTYVYHVVTDDGVVVSEPSATASATTLP